MTVEIRPEDYRSLAAYASIPSRFEVRERIDVAALDEPGKSLPVQSVARPWIKDYDAIPSNDPLSWSTRFDTQPWTFLAAFSDGRRVGGAIVVADENVVSLGGRTDFSLLWDLRVAPEWRRHGIARALLAEVDGVARTAGSRGVDVETQDTNVAACRVYAASGFTLRDIDSAAYPDLPGETKLIWTKLFP